jgi:aldose 1-epimerase
VQVARAVAMWPPSVTAVAVRTDESRFAGEPAVTLEAGELTATFLPAVGMTGVSLRFRGREHLALPGGVGHLRAGGTGGLPLLAPWANRLASRRYRAAGVVVDLGGLPLVTDDHGLPIHGLLVGASGWRVERCDVRGRTARLRASIDVDAPAFPFPHRLELLVTARDRELGVETTVIPTGRRRVPIAFGWHPYLRVPGVPRGRWRLRLPTRRHLALDSLGIPTGAETVERAEAAPIGRRTFDDLYALGREHRLAFETDDATIEMRSDRAYPYAQVWVPAGRSFAALEPMTAPTNALASGTTPLVAPRDSYTARFTLTLR